MSKREASQIAAAAGVDIDAPRAKRRREVPASTDNSGVKAEHASPGSNDISKPKTEGEDDKGIKEDPELVKEKGLKLWQTVKDAVNKEGRPLSHDFMRLPSKRQYADYYQQIKRPIALDDIKSQLDIGAYQSFEDVRQDLETCFRNAKRYNMKESQIWKDAKSLHKLVTKEYSKMTGTVDEGGEDADDHAAGSDDEGTKKKKPPNLTRLLKTRLQKVAEKTDEEGRVLSTEFMDLPNRKQWSIYYKTIKRPQCLENVFKHLKRKEYHTSQEFANDVELVFSNALEFNQEHTPIWEDALTLRDYFRQLMSDLPPPHAIPAYSPAESSGKIKLKVPAVSSSQLPAQPPTDAAPSYSVHSSGTLRIPAQHAAATNGATSQSNAVPEQSKSPVVVPKLQPSAVSHPAPQNAITPINTVVPAPVPAVAQLRGSTATPNTNMQSNGYPYNSAYTHHYPNTSYHPNVTPIAPAAVSTAAPAPSTQAIPASTPAPAASTSQMQTPPPPSRLHPLKCATLVTKPLDRHLVLNHKDGVKVWAMRLSGETGVRVTGLVLVSHGEDEESGEEEEMEQQEEEEEEEEQPKPKRGRGRPRKKSKPAEPLKPADIPKAKNKGKSVANAAFTLEQLELKLNGVLVTRTPESNEDWDIELPVGMNVVELGEKGGAPWRIYLDRLNL